MHSELATFIFTKMKKSWIPSFLFANIKCILIVKQSGSQMWPHVLRGLIWTQTVCNSHQRSSKFIIIWQIIKHFQKCIIHCWTEISKLMLPVLSITLENGYHSCTDSISCINIRLFLLKELTWLITYTLNDRISGYCYHKWCITKLDADV